MITDCYHYRTPGMNFHRGFHAYDWIRGQEYDTWKSNPTRRNIEDYVNDNYDKGWRERISQYLSNTDDILQEEDYFPARVAASACEWLALNRSHPRIFAWIDSFDPHEPWDPPSRFDNYTDPAYKGKRLIFPMGNLLADQWATPEEIRYIRGLYAGEAAFVDHCVGQVLQTLKELGYYDDSVIFITADHGHPLGDHNKFLKGGGRLYSELLKVPFMVRCPGAKCARRTDAIVQFHDVLPTVLELAGLGNTTSAMQGRSFLPVLLGDSDTHRSEIITGYHESAVRCIRDSKWTYIQRAEGEPDELYNLEDDPREQKNLIDEFPEEAKRLASTFGRNFRKKGAQTAVKGIQKRYELAGLG
ncbi:MAG: sulfatase [Chloroflexi bacterium]|nr:MAG: sulfatase [Chloroflexota bacterium]